MNNHENDGCIDAYDDYDVLERYDSSVVRKHNRTQKRRKPKPGTTRTSKPGHRRSERVESRDGTFRCKQCKTIVGKPISGGRHRNHCPLCLYSRHVDLKTPGDRASECRSLMVPIGLFTRGDGEQMLVHECLGCGVTRHNRVAADDNVVAIMRLPVVSVGVGKRDRRVEIHSA